MLEAIVEDVYNLLGVLDSPYFSMLIAPDKHGTMAFLDWTEILFSLIWRSDAYKLIFFLISTKSSGRSMCRSLMSWIQINVLYRLRYIVVPWTFVDIIFLGHINCHISFVENGSTNGYFVGFLSWTFHLWMDYATISTKIGAHEQNVI